MFDHTSQKHKSLKRVPQRRNSVIVLNARVYCTLNVEKKGFFNFNQYCGSGSHSALNYESHYLTNFSFLHVFLFVLMRRTVKN
jgi:hypothetical protein